MHRRAVCCWARDRSADRCRRADGVANADLAGYTTYTNGQATLIVDSDIDRSAILA
jgi:hypothetical protein